MIYLIANIVFDQIERWVDLLEAIFLRDPADHRRPEGPAGARPPERAVAARRLLAVRLAPVDGDVQNQPLRLREPQAAQRHQGGHLRLPGRVRGLPAARPPAAAGPDRRQIRPVRRLGPGSRGGLAPGRGAARGDGGLDAARTRFGSVPVAAGPGCLVARGPTT